MGCSGITSGLKWIGVVLAMAVVPNLGAEPGDEYWDDSFYTKSLSDYALCAVMGSGGEIYVGGRFMSADNIAVNRVARWDGAEWHALGEGLSGPVVALIVDSGGNVYAGGNFRDAAGDPDADFVAMWDGSSWASLGGPNSGLDGIVNALSIDSNGDLLAGGEFEDAGGDFDADHIAVWDGSSWSSIGGTGSGVDGAVEAIAFSPGGELIIGGGFNDAGGVAAADHIAAWNGSSWTALGGGLNGSVYALSYAASGALYVGGNFTDAGGDPDADRIAVWSSPTWRSVGGADSGLNQWVHAIGISGTGKIFIGGSFTNAGGDPDADRVARWSPTSGWISMDGPGSGLSSTVYGLIIDDGNLPVVVGGFADAGGHEYADYITRWNAGDWSPLSRDSLPEGDGLNDYVYALALDSRRRLYAGGGFSDAGGDPAADHIAVWDGSGWSAMGPEDSIDGYVFAIVENTDGHIVVAGDFADAGGDPDGDNIALWNGVAWSSLGGSGSRLDGYVYALIVTTEGKIVAGGDFQNAGGDPAADNVAVWDGVSWSALAGPGGGIESTVWALDLDEAGNLFAGGEFSDAGGDPDANGVAKWDGISWTSVGGPGSGINSAVYAVAVDDLGRVFVGGDFVNIGGDPDADYFALWDGAAWTAPVASLNGAVWDLEFDGVGDLYVAGEFDSDSNPLHPTGIAVWDGISWDSLGSGLDHEGYALTYDGGFSVFVDGEFFTAGDKSSVRVGRFRGATPAGLLFADGFESGDLSAWDP